MGRCCNSRPVRPVTDEETEMILASVTISALLILLMAAGAVMHQQAERLRIKRLYTVFLEESLTDALGGNIEKMWVLRDEGIETVLQRGRPDLDPPRQPTRPPGQIINLTNVKEDNE